MLFYSLKYHRTETGGSCERYESFKDGNLEWGKERLYFNSWI